MLSNSFVHLHVHSAYSLAEGAIKTKDLMSLCQEHNMPAVAVTDTNNLFGALEFAMAAVKSGVQPILGCQIQVGTEKHQLVLLVQSEIGFRNLSKLVSDSFMVVDTMEEPHVSWESLEECNGDLICLSGGIRGPTAQYFLHNQDKDAAAITKRLKKIFAGRFYIELQRHGLAEEDSIEERLIDLAYKLDIPLVATNDCYFPRREMHEAHDALLCIADGRYVMEENRRTVTPEHYFKSSDEMKSLFKDVPEAIENTSIIAQRCHYILKPIDPILPPFETEGGRDEDTELAAQSKDGLDWRLENFVFTEDMDDKAKEETSKPYYERLEYELRVITDMGFPGYFLIVSDFIKWAKEQNIPVGPGRGSGAGSVVAWALKITDLDPLEFALLFERFLNPERVSMPDFDIDFCQDRRDEVIRYVQDKYGYDKVAQIITFGKLQARAVVRDVGRVLQMPYGQVDRISKLIPANPANPVTLQEALEQEPDLQKERDRDESADKLITLALQLEGLFRHASTHAAGVVIGDRPLHELVPLYRDPRSDMPVTQFNMKYVEQAGLVKFDFLGLKTMTVIQKTVEFIKDTIDEDVDILKIPFDDDKTFAMLRRGENTGVFQMESAGMRDLGRQMKISNFEQIIALVALYRPGPMENIPKYLACLNGFEEKDYMHPILQPILEETYGIMIYQEQVMQAAQELAGYTLGAADLLRRAMGKKIQAEMDEQRALFVNGAAEYHQVEADQANHIFDQIAKFAGYGFNKAHSAGYALIAYWTAWLKANYPVQFMAASMTLDMQNTEKLAIFKQELDRMDIELRPPSVSDSNVEFKVEEDSVRYALAALKGVGTQAMETLVLERDENGVYTDLNEFSQRIDTSGLNKRQFEQMACAGAFDAINKNRAQVHASAELVLKHAQTLASERASGQSSLFGGEGGALSNLPPLPEMRQWDTLEQLRREFNAIGFYLSAHPLDSKAEQLERLKIITMSKVPRELVGRGTALIDMAGVLIKIQVKVSPKSGNKYAFLQMSDSSGVYEVMMFSETLLRARDYLKVGETLLLKVIAEERDEQMRYTVQDVKPLEEALTDKVKEIQIVLDKPDPVQKLKALLDEEGKGKAIISVLIETTDDEAIAVTLPSRWRFSVDAKREFMREEGVCSVREF